MIKMGNWLYQITGSDVKHAKEINEQMKAENDGWVSLDPIAYGEFVKAMWKVLPC